LPKQTQQKWRIACKGELKVLERCQVFDLVDLPKGRKTVNNQWIFTVKFDSRKKAHLVAHGFSQVEGIDFDEIFSPVVRYESVRTLLAVAALEDWEITGLDVKSAFLYGPLEEEIYMRQPEGFVAKGHETKVLRLKRAIYGLKQAALAWWKELAKYIKSQGFTRIESDARIFVFEKGSTIVAVYVETLSLWGMIAP
jgi:hypothetical protein